jgi:hypothetical protein
VVEDVGALAGIVNIKVSLTGAVGDPEGGVTVTVRRTWTPAGGSSGPMA